MSVLQRAQQYFDAWNDHDAQAIVDTFAPGGTYVDPTTGGPLAGEAIGHYAAGLWAAFPDLAFEVVSVDLAGEGKVAAQWLMRGTNHGSMLGLPPTGVAVALPGADFIAVEESGIRSVVGYFDSAALPRQLGLQTIVQPEHIGPFRFGVSNAAQSGKQMTPGALSYTSLVLRGPDERAAVSNYSRQIVPEMLQMPGFISFAGITVGHRMITLSTWESADDPKQLLRGGTHKESVSHFYGDGHYLGGVTSVWTPVRVSYNARCGECGRMYHQNEPITQCRCGADLSLPDGTW